MLKCAREKEYKIGQMKNFRLLLQVGIQKQFEYLSLYSGIVGTSNENCWKDYVFFIFLQYLRMKKYLEIEEHTET